MKFGILSLALLGFVFSNQGFACSCAQPDTAEKELGRATAVFTGKVKSMQVSGRDKVVSFSVNKFYKGSDWLQNVAVRTAGSSAACGFGFQQNQEYLVYTHLTEGGFISTSICTRTTTLAKAGAETDELDKLTTP